MNIDPDALARKINNGNPERSKVSAGKEAIRIARECIRNKWDFTVETTLVGGNVLRQMRDAKEQGYKIIMFYVGLGDVRLNGIKYHLNEIPEWTQLIDRQLQIKYKEA
ncbi:hypothetical protein [Paenibacillus sp. FSL H8-0332]|uniref:hypothetical protein n=1 Tax=Paenibacillus sp. FSL H8-0332 TaxID=2954742 RepID=UPI0030CF8155